MFCLRYDDEDEEEVKMEGETREREQCCPFSAQTSRARCWCSVMLLTLLCHDQPELLELRLAERRATFDELRALASEQDGARGGDSLA